MRKLILFQQIREYLDKNRTLINIFLVYFFLTFVIGYIDFDSRVKSFEFSTHCLRQVVQREAGSPLDRRVLVPYIVYFFHKFFHIPLDYTFAGFRFIFFFLAFVLFHLYLKKWFDDKLAMIGTLSLIASLPIALTNWYCIPTDLPELIVFILGAMWIRDNKYKQLFILIPLATLNKESSAILVLLYFLNALGKERTDVLIKRTIIYFLLWLIPLAVLISIFDISGIEDIPNLIFNFRGRGELWAGPGIFYNFKINSENLLSAFKSPHPYKYSFFLIYLCGFYWILAFRDFRKKASFLKRSVIIMVLHFLYAFSIAAGIHEVRIFLLFYVFVIPLGLFSLFKNEHQSSH